MSFKETTAIYREAAVRIFGPVLPLLKFVRSIAFAAFFLYLGLELITPSLKFSDPSDEYYKNEGTPEWVSFATSSGTTYRIYKNTLTTYDNRSLDVEVFIPPGPPSNLPLTVIAANFIPPEQLADWIQPRGNNAIIIYRSPRLEKIMGNAFPRLKQLGHINSFSGFIDFLAENPLAYWYNMQQALHEAPYDISEIVRWATQRLNIDKNRINLLGLGSGSLEIAAAGHRLRNMGLTSRSLTLIYPPADLDSAIRDNLIFWPQWSRRPASLILAFVYRRLDLTRHLSPADLQIDKRLMVVPINAFELYTSAALPAADLAGPGTNIEHINVNYALYYDKANIATIRNRVANWLTAEGAINAP